MNEKIILHRFNKQILINAIKAIPSNTVDIIFTENSKIVLLTDNKTKVELTTII